MPDKSTFTYYSLQCGRNDATVHWDVGTADTRLIWKRNNKKQRLINNCKWKYSSLTAGDFLIALNQIKQTAAK